MWVAGGDLCWWCCGFCGFGGVCAEGDLGFSESDSVSFSTFSLCDNWCAFESFSL
jgi:hypothetical protein